MITTPLRYSRFQNTLLSTLLLILSSQSYADQQAPFECTPTLDGNTWCAIRDFGQRNESELGLGTGAFLSFQSLNAQQKWGDWVLLNGGLLDLTSGAEQADLDLIVYIDGRPSGIALQGRVGKNNPALFPVYDGEIDIGRPYSSFRNMFLSGILYLPKSPTCPYALKIAKSPSSVDCVQVVVDGKVGYLPVYR